MKYISTRGGIAPIGFSETVLMGLGRDGGLIIPETIPDVRGKLKQWASLSYKDLAVEIMRLFVDMPEEDLAVLIEGSCSEFDDPDVVRVVETGSVQVLELFHGPTLAFKDLALQFLGRLFEHVLAGSGRELNILAATSGDTGSAAIHGVRGRKGIRIFVLHPHKRVSRVQELQMTTVLDENVHNLAIEGTFDDCQAIVKQLFRDLDFKDRYSLGAVNSINWARILAQMVYYFYGAFRVMDRSGCLRVRFAVPTGNFGDIFAGYMAARMGLPVGLLVLAANENDILARFFNSGDYSVVPVRATLSPSMDIQVASNFERYLYYRMGCDAARVRRAMEDFGRTGRLDVSYLPSDRDGLFAAGSADREQTLATIRAYYEKHGYLLDPHTAVGVHVAQSRLHAREPMICLATAHPAKFGETVKLAVGKDVARHARLDALEALPTRVEVLPNSTGAVRDYIKAAIGA